MPIQLELVREGQRVSYEDRANPRRTGRVTAVDESDQWSPYTIRWDDDGTVDRTDLRQHGWHLVAGTAHFTADGATAGIFDGADILSAYTRAQALEDGVLVDVTDTAREAGFTVPMALTRAAWEECVAWDAEAGRPYQDEPGRLWDVVWMARCAGSRSRPSADRVAFQVLRVPNRPRTRIARPFRLVAVIGPGDRGEPVATIMVEGED